MYIAPLHMELPYTKEQKCALMSSFPQSIQLFHDEIQTKKVEQTQKFNLYFAIPEGNASFLWFAEPFICVLLKYDENESITDMNVFKLSTNCSQYVGTVLHGTCFTARSATLTKPCFAIDDVLTATIPSTGQKGTLGQPCQASEVSRDAANMFMMKKLAFLRDLLSHVPIFVGLCLGIAPFNEQFMNLLKTIDGLPYKISSIRFRCTHKPRNQTLCGVKYFKPSQNKLKDATTNLTAKSERIFKVQAQAKCDLYHLLNDETSVYDSLACIPDLKTSTYMNSIFRKIKENANLDALEESDDDDEFEDSSTNKFVDLAKIVRMKCVYNPTFKKWVPVLVV